MDVGHSSVSKSGNIFSTCTYTFPLQNHKAHTDTYKTYRNPSKTPKRSPNSRPHAILTFSVEFFWEALALLSLLALSMLLNGGIWPSLVATYDKVEAPNPQNPKPLNPKPLNPKPSLEGALGFKA